MSWPTASLHFSKFLVYIGIKWCLRFALRKVIFQRIDLRVYCTSSCLAAKQVNTAEEQDILTLEDGTATLSRNVCNKLPYAAPQDRIPQLYPGESLITSQNSPVVTGRFVPSFYCHTSKVSALVFHHYYLKFTNIIVIGNQKMYNCRLSYQQHNVTVKPEWQS